jgi:hypothetical protein
MKTLLALVAAISVVVIVVLAVTGALRVRNAGDEVHITIDKKDVKEKAEQAIDKTKHLGKRVAEKHARYSTRRKIVITHSPPRLRKTHSLLIRQRRIPESTTRRSRKGRPPNRANAAGIHWRES